MGGRLTQRLLRSAWPAQAVDQLLRAAFLGDEAEAAAAWMDFEKTADFDHLTPGEMRLIGFVSKRLAALAPDSPMRARVGGIERANWSRSQLAVGEAGSGLRWLASAGIDMLVIKGASRAAAGDVGARARMVNDVDIVVRPEAMQRAFDLLTGDGWMPAGSGSVLFHRSRLPDVVGINLVRGRFGNLDLHRTAFHPPYDAEGEDAAIWDRSRPGRLGYVAVRVPSPTDAVAIALAHGALDAHKSSDWLADIAAHVDAGIAWDLLEDIVARHRLQAPAAIALSYLAERLGRPVPGPVLRRLEAGAAARPLVLLAAVSETRPKSRTLGLAWLARAVSKQCRLFRAHRRRSRNPVVLPRLSLARRMIDGREKAVEQVLDLPLRQESEAWHGIVEVAIAVDRSDVRRRVEFEVNLRDRHLVRLRGLLFRGGHGERVLRFRFPITLAAGESSPRLVAVPSRRFNSDAPAALLDRYGPKPFALLDFRAEKVGR
jgi:hypothetical protein